MDRTLLTLFGAAGLCLLAILIVAPEQFLGTLAGGVLALGMGTIFGRPD